MKNPFQLRLLAYAALLCSAAAQAGTYEFHTPKPGLQVAPAVDLTPRLGVSTQSLAFPDTTVGQASALQSLLVTNGGGSALSFSAAPSVTGPFVASTTCGAGLAPAEDCSVSVSFTPAQMGPASGSLQLVTSAGSALVDLSGSGMLAALGTTPNSLSLGSARRGEQTAGYLTLTNLGNMPVTLGVPSVALPFSITGTNCPATLAMGASCQLTVSFAPTAKGLYSSTLYTQTSAGTQSTPVSGTGIAGLVSYLSEGGSTLTSLTFPNTSVGSSATASVVVKNTGDDTLAFSGSALTTQAPYSLSANTCTGATLAPNSTCSVTVTFTPPAANTYGSGSYTLAASSDAQPTNPLYLYGSGVQALFGFASNTPEYLFNSTQVGTSADTTQAVALVNNGTATGSLTLPAFGGSHPQDFSATSNCSNITTSNQCTVTVSFRPTAEGTRTATLTLGGATRTFSGYASLALTGQYNVNFAAYSNGARLANGTDVNYYGPYPYWPTGVVMNYTCTQAYHIGSILCASNTVPSANWTSNAIGTWANTGGGMRYVVIDLGQSRVFNTAYFYQANGDGRSTSGQIAVSDTLLPYASTSWNVLGSKTLNTSDFGPQALRFTAASGRYVRLGVANAGPLFPGYVELHGLQLFFE